MARLSFKVSKNKQKKSSEKFRLLRNFVIGLALLAIAGLVVYSYQAFKTSQIEKEGIVVCNREGICEKSIHIHSELNVLICGKEQKLPKEEGELSDIHTHKEANLVHFHERLRVDRQGDILDPSPLTLANTVKKLLVLELTNNCIGSFCNGDSCPNGRRGALLLEVNGQERGEIAGYVWKDGDVIGLTFD